MFLKLLLKQYFTTVVKLFHAAYNISVLGFVKFSDVVCIYVAAQKIVVPVLVIKTKIL